MKQRPRNEAAAGAGHDTGAGRGQRGALATAPALACEGWPWGMGQRPM